MMTVSGKSNVKIKRFKDLKTGDVFYFLKDLDKDIGLFNENLKIYIRCGHTNDDKWAMNLQTGIIYSFSENEPVEVLNVALKIEEKNKR